MITFIDTYEKRKREIEDFLEMMIFLEILEREKEDGISKFEKIFHLSENHIRLSYQSLINMHKSNISLMLYNIIEYTVSNLIISIYDEIERNELSYVDVNDCIKKLWSETRLKVLNDPNASFNTFLKTNNAIIQEILSNNVLTFNVKKTMSAGNLDGNSIKKTLNSHGIKLRTNSDNYRPEILERIKNRRNELAHGSVSFVDAAREQSISDIKNSKDIIIGFLDELIDTVSNFIEKEKFKN